MYELYYWPTIQGRGEFVRLLLEDAGADYIDVVRKPESEGGGVQALRALVKASEHFAPPFLKDGETMVSQTPLIMDYLGERHGLTPRDTDRRRDTLRLSMLLLHRHVLHRRLYSRHIPTGVLNRTIRTRRCNGLMYRLWL